MYLISSEQSGETEGCANHTGDDKEDEISDVIKHTQKRFHEISTQSQHPVRESSYNNSYEITLCLTFHNLATL